MTELKFRGSNGNGGAADTDTIAALATELQTEHDDFCATLSGGQRAKLELVRSVLIKPACPPLLLLDEYFAPLDAASKATITRRLRSACASSVVVAVYHPDEEATDANSDSELCELGPEDSPFFDSVLEVKGGVLLPPRACPR